MEPVVDAVVSRIAEPAVDSVWRQISYIWNYGDNIQSLKDQVENLKHQRTFVEHNIEESRRNTEEIEDKVTKWLKNVNEIIKAAEKILQDNDAANQRCFMGCRPSLKSRYKLSREAKKETPIVDGFRREGKFDKVSYRPVIEGIAPVKDYENFESRMQIFNQIVEALKAVDVNMVGLYGMGGVGKTMMAKKVAERVKEDGNFKVFVMANVTQKADLKKIQQDIADCLGLKLVKSNELVRATQICKRLKQEERILLILDDIWDAIKLEDVGIPSANDHMGCKIMLTSRDLNILRKMGINRNHFKLQVLEDEEAKHLFEKKAGPLKDPEIQLVSSEVAKRCAGLPIAIVAVATALKDKELYEWNDALRRLKQSADENMDEQVQSCLELSYNFLKNDEKKDLFLICGSLILFSSLDLLKYAVGMRLFMVCKTLKEARDKLLTYLNDLKSSCLLLEGNDNDEIKMHDIVRSFAIKVAARDLHLFNVTYDTLPEWPPKDELDQYTAIILDDSDIPELPTTFECPRLHLFVLSCKMNQSLGIPDDLFMVTKELRVLDFTRVTLPTLPLSIQYLKNLRTLCLYYCILEDISIIGKLNKLQVLSLDGSQIVQLPRELEQLTRLQLLDLSDCSSLQVIPPNVLSKLVHLEELYMGNCFVQWESEAQGGQMKNASLSEIKALKNLVALDIHIIDPNILPRDLFSKKLERFKIFIGEGWDWSKHEGSKVLKVNLNTRVHLEAIKVLLKKTENLHLDELKSVKNVLGELDKEGFAHLKQLSIQNSVDVEEIWPNQLTESSSWIKNLTTLVTDTCRNLSYVFTSTMAESLVQLKNLKISNCESIKEVIITEGEAKKIQLLILKLESLKLKGLNSLTRFCTGKLIQCPSLKELWIENCPLLQAFISSSKNVDEGSSSRAVQAKSFLFDEKVLIPSLATLHVHDCDSVEGVFAPQVLGKTQEADVVETSQLRILCLRGLPNLKNVWNVDSCGIPSYHNLHAIHALNCPSLKNLFPFSIAQNLPQLEMLRIVGCGMGAIVAKEERVESAPKFIFPRLKFFVIRKSQELKHFYPGTHTLKCPVLKKLSVCHCDKLEAFATKSVDKDLPETQMEFPLFSFKEIVPNLEELPLTSKDATMIQQSQFPEGFFHELKVVKITCYHDESAVFPFDLLERFYNMEKLKVRCSRFKYLFPHELVGKEFYAKTMKKIRFLKLDVLADLKHIWHPGSQLLDQVLQSLEMLKVCDCDSLVSLAPSSASFQNLTSMDIESCNALASLLTFSTAKSLLQLKTLSIKGCNTLTEIVASVGNDGSKEEIILVKLETLKLLCLPSLISFCSAEHSFFQFPSLSQAVVQQCPKMQVFSKGDLSTPKLKLLQVTEENDNKGHWSGNLNATIQQLFKEMAAYSGMALLKLSECPRVKQAWHDQLPAHLFRNLDTLVIDDCAFTSSLVPPNVLPFLGKLKMLEVANCNAVEQVFEWSNANGFVGHLSNLTSLTVQSCGNLKYVLSSSMIRSLVHLQSIEVRDCEQMQQVIVSQELAKEAMTSMMLLSKLGSLKLENLPKLAQFCTVDLLKCPSLKELELKNCPQLMTFVSYPSSVVGASTCESETLNSALFDEKVLFPSLDSLIVYDCDSIEEVFAPQVLGKTPKANIVEASQLRYLDIDGLRNLKNVWHVDSCGIPSYHNLHTIYASNCASLKNLFPFSIAQNLPQLELLTIDSCGMGEIVAKEGRVGSPPKFIIPRLQYFVIWRSQELKHFYPGTHTLECPMLEMLSVCHCDKLEVFATESVDKNLPETQMEYPLFSFKEVVPNLEQLSLTSKDATIIQQSQFPEGFFQKLKALVITCYHDESAVFPFDLLERFHNLEKLKVRFSQFKYLFPHEHVGKEYYAKTMKKIRFLKLDVLADLKHIWHQDSQLLDQVLQSLEILEVCDCDSLVTLAPSSASFQNLTSMDIESCDALASLLTFSTAKSLLQLKTLSIKECNMLTEIVASVGNDGSKEEIILHKLETLKLLCLPSLISFCSAEHSFFQFPSLTQAIVQRCPKMQVFSKGDLSTPKLKLLQVTEENDDKGHWSGNLNATIQHLFTKTNAEGSIF